MDFNLKFIKSENQLNKIIKKQKRDGSLVRLLFVSLWDKWSNSLVASLKKNDTSKGTLLYVIDSFTMPHSFVIYKTRKTPSLVTLGKRQGSVSVDDHLPSIHDSLGI